MSQQLNKGKAAKSCIFKKDKALNLKVTYREGADSEVQDPHINRELMGRIQTGMRPKLFPIPKSSSAPATGSHANRDPLIVSVRVCVNPSRGKKNYASQQLFFVRKPSCCCFTRRLVQTRCSFQLHEMRQRNKHRIKHPSQNTHPVTWAQSLRILAVLRRFVRFTEIFFFLSPSLSFQPPEEMSLPPETRDVSWLIVFGLGLSPPITDRRARAPYEQLDQFCTIL